ncbi:MAG: DoxX family membrane protein [Pseudomonadota bacterium]
MTALVRIHNGLFHGLERLTGAWLLPTLARLVFAGVLLMYFWASAMTKIGDGILGIVRPDDGAYIQIFPRLIENAGYDFSVLGIYHWFVVLAGTYAEFILPALIVIGLFTRLAAIGMIGFIIVQSLTDIVGHHADATTIGTWFDRISDALIVDQRAFWVFLLLLLVVRGAGPLSVDRFILEKPSEA